MKITKTLLEFRTDMKNLGYKVNVRTGSEFKMARVMDNGVCINSGNVMSQEHLNRHKAFYEYKQKHNVRDGDWVVTF